MTQLPSTKQVRTCKKIALVIVGTQSRFKLVYDFKYTGVSFLVLFEYYGTTIISDSSYTNHVRTGFG